MATPTPATGYFNNLLPTLDGIATDIDAKLAAIEEQKAALARDRARIAAHQMVERMYRENPDALFLLDSTASDLDIAA